MRQGNAGFVDGQPRFRTVHAQRHAEFVEGQHPSTTVLDCSDSRVPPKIVFGAALGDLFVIRVAGNILDPAIVGMFQYAAGLLSAAVEANVRFSVRRLHESPQRTSATRCVRDEVNGCCVRALHWTRRVPRLKAPTAGDVAFTGRNCLGAR